MPGTPESDDDLLNPHREEDIEKATRRLLEKACDRDLTLAAAESCTGGMLASLLTDVQGWAHAFDRGFVTYTDESKAEMLGVPIDLIQREGAVPRLFFSFSVISGGKSMVIHDAGF